MRKYLVSFLALTFLMASIMLGGCTDDKKAGNATKLAVVDMQRLVRDSEPGKAAEKFWESLMGEMRSSIAGLEGKLEKDQKNEALEKEFQTAYMQAQQRLQLEQQNMANVLNDVIQRSLNSLREKKGYDVILDSEMVRSFGPAVDVTNDAILEVNTQKVEFKPMTLPKDGNEVEEAAKAAEAEAGATKPEAKSEVKPDGKAADKKQADTDKKPEEKK